MIPFSGDCAPFGTAAGACLSLSLAKTRPS
jgi:hypothetical protein